MCFELEESIWYVKNYWFFCKDVRCKFWFWKWKVRESKGGICYYLKYFYLCCWKVRLNCELLIENWYFNVGLCEMKFDVFVVIGD